MQVSHVPFDQDITNQCSLPMAGYKLIYDSCKLRAVLAKCPRYISARVQHQVFADPYVREHLRPVPAFVIVHDSGFDQTGIHHLKNISGPEQFVCLYDFNRFDCTLFELRIKRRQVLEIT